MNTIISLMAACACVIAASVSASSPVSASVVVDRVEGNIAVCEVSVGESFLKMVSVPISEFEAPISEGREFEITPDCIWVNTKSE